MATRIALNHTTQYAYDRLVFLSPHLIRLKPAAHTQATIESYSLTIEPENRILHWQQDPFGNFVARVDFPEAVQSMTIKAGLVAELNEVNPFDFFVDAEAARFPVVYDASLKKDLRPYLEVEKPGPLQQQWLTRLRHTSHDTIAFLVEVNQQVYRSVAYTERMQPGVQTAEETLQRAVGSCRDSGWLLVQLLRHLGLAARFVSGYLVQVNTYETIPVDQVATQGESVALHAWAEVYLPGAGWIGLDATSGMLTTSGHIPLACTPCPTGAAPVTGTSGLSESTLSYQSTLVHLP